MKKTSETDAYDRSAWIEDEFSGLDAVAQAEWARAGRVSSTELVDAAIKRIERVGPLVNALASVDFERARERACRVASTGLLAGVPTLLKDLLAYPGLPFECGSRAFVGQRAQAGSDYTDALDEAGLIVLGKSTSSELGLLGTTETLACGATRNPWDLTRSAGGSSGGAVAAVASGLVAVAHASDGGGSIRGPASLCGLFGFKPGRGRHRSTGPMADSPFGRLVSDHCVSRTVRDSAAWLAVTELRDGEARPVGYVAEPLRRRLRIGWYRANGFGHEPEPDVAAALERTVQLCASLGHELIECGGPPYQAAATSAAFFDLAGTMTAGLFGQLQQAFGAGFDQQRFEPFTRELVQRAGADPIAGMGVAMAELSAAQMAANQGMQAYDVLLCPTVPFTAFPLGHIGPTKPAAEVIAFTERLAGYTAIASIAGWCAMSVPLHESFAGLPIGMHFAAKPGHEAILLGLAYQLEEAAPWRQRTPGRLKGTDGTAA
ncbi:amidase [Dyella silvatica]|uniref:amidase n=1 Tax=Dyella silvatica TaxID=2992128 RepID=UPI00224D06C2|nr:amidase family protein [Dyella silvatica]